MRPSMPRSLPALAQDAVFCVALALVALMLGLAVNQWRAVPLPMPYQTKEARLAAEVAELKNRPATTAEIRYLLPEDFAALPERNSLTVLDARPEVFYQQGHIAGALPLPRESFRAFYEQHQARLEKDKSQRLVIYCQGGECEDSEMVAKALSQLGFTNLSILVGGWEGWQSRSDR